ELPWYVPGEGRLFGATKAGKTVAALGRARRLSRALSGLQVAVPGVLRPRWERERPAQAAAARVRTGRTTGRGAVACLRARYEWHVHAACSCSRQPGRAAARRRW